MRIRPHFVVLTALASLALGSVPASACTSAKAARTVDVLPRVWQSAVLELVGASALEGLPWGCTGGTIDLTLHEGGATLTVVDASGQAVSREVTSPDEVVPLGEALLTKPLPNAAPLVAPPPVHTEPAATPTPDRKTSAKANKRVYAVLGAGLAPRYAGRSNLIWGGVTASVGIPFSSWLAGAWFRYDGPAASLEREMHLTEVCVGANFARSFAVDPVEIRAGIRPSVAILNQSFGRAHEDATRVDARIGVEATAVFPVASPVRALIGFDAELSPREVGEDDRRRPPGQNDPMGPPDPHQYDPTFPSYTIGLGVGVEVAIR